MVHDGLGVFRERQDQLDKTESRVERGGIGSRPGDAGEVHLKPVTLLLSGGLDGDRFHRLSDSVGRARHDWSRMVNLLVVSRSQHVQGRIPIVSVLEVGRGSSE